MCLPVHGPQPPALPTRSKSRAGRSRSRRRAGFSLASDNTDATGLWGDDDTIWVANNGSGPDNNVFAYNRADGTRDSSTDFNTLYDSPPGITDPNGLCSDGTTMYVVDSSADKIYGFNLSTKSYVSSKTVTLHTDNSVPEGLWCNATTIWVANDGAGNKVFAYKLTTSGYGDRDTSLEFDTLDAAGNRAPRGLWSDGATMYIVDRGNNKVYAYNTSDQTRDPDKDFDLGTDNNDAEGIWSDG